MKECIDPMKSKGDLLRYLGIGRSRGGCMAGRSFPLCAVVFQRFLVRFCESKKGTRGRRRVEFSKDAGDNRGRDQNNHLKPKNNSNLSSALAHEFWVSARIRVRSDGGSKNYRGYLANDVHRQFHSHFGTVTREPLISHQTKAQGFWPGRFGARGLGRRSKLERLGGVGSKILLPLRTRHSISQAPAGTQSSAWY